ncbi:MAG: prepilin-type N-terminal cleavage/methylation domain-containing protein [Acetobacterium sp.]
MKTFKKRSMSGQSGFTLVELMVTLAILSLLTASVFTIGFSNPQKITEASFNAECENVLYTLLQYKDEALMDGNRRQVRFFEKSILINWTNDHVNHQVSIPLKTCKLSTSYLQTNPLQLKGVGTVSMGGTVTFTSDTGTKRIITFQVGNGRIYLDEP